MLSRVLDALQAVSAVTRIAIVADASADVMELPGLAMAMKDGGVMRLEPAAGPVGSVAAALDVLGTETPILVTTADHPLLSTEMLEHFLRHAPKHAAVSVGVAEESVVRAVYPGAVRTFYRFKDESVSGCNLFLLRGQKARPVVDFWRRVETARKQPWRVAMAVGPSTLAAFFLGRLGLEAAMARLSRRVNAPLACVRLPFAEAAIDVDKPADLAIVERILAQADGQDAARPS
jgi:GTP:adenosylcobinamide-phosphate guanylyltransferase